MAIDHFNFDTVDDLPDGGKRFHWTPASVLFTPAGTLQGGAGLGATTAAMEIVTGRPTIWATAQYLSFASGTESLNIDVNVEVSGYNTSQVRCVLSRSGQEILTTHAAMGSRDTTMDDRWDQPLTVAAPNDCPRYRFFERGAGHLGDLSDFRLAHGRQLDDIAISKKKGDGSFALWVKCWEGSRMVTSSDIAFIGDFMPLGFADAIGAPFAGNSLDNTIRIGTLVPTQWVLISIRVHQVANGFGHGSASLWAESGTLLGNVSQTSVMRQHKSIRQRSA